MVIESSELGDDWRDEAKVMVVNALRSSRIWKLLTRMMA